MEKINLQSIKIRIAHPSDYVILAEKHLEVFPGFFMSTLGTSFLQTYYKYVLKHPDTVCFFAEKESLIVGYVVGRLRTKGFLKSVVRRNPIPFFWQGVKLVFTHPKSLMRIFKNFEKRQSDGAFQDSQNYGEIGLIGISSEMKGKGIGRLLLKQIETVLLNHNVTKLSLTTDYFDNEYTLAAYKAWGFHVLYDFVAYPDRRMYRLIKDII